MSVAKMKDGKRWYAFIRYKDWTGKTRQHKKEGFQRKYDAQQYEREFRQKIEGSSDMTVRALRDLYMEDCKARLRVTTIGTKSHLIRNHILPSFGDTAISDLTPANIRLWQNQLVKQGLKPSTIKMINAQLSAMLNFAVKYYGLSRNPCVMAGPVGSLKTKEMSFWTPEQFEQFLPHVRDHTARTTYFLLFWTGMRVGEAMALTPGDFDFTVPAVKIGKTYHRLNGQDVYTPPKTEGSKRTVILTDRTSDMMQRFISSLFDPDNDTRIFAPRSISFFRVKLKQGCKDAGMELIRIHDLRHSHASLMIELGYSPLLIAERLGHESVDTTLKTYSHLYPNKQVDLVQRLNRL